MPEYKHVGDHAVEITKGDKSVMLGFGELIDLTAKELEADHNQDLVDSGVLLPTKAKGGDDK